MQARLVQDQMMASFDAVGPGLTEDHLPVLVAGDIAGPVMRACGLTWWLLSRWLGAGAAAPFTVEDAAKELHLKPDEVVEVFNVALGDQKGHWKCGLQDILPRQFCLLVHQSLARLKETYETGQEVQGAQQQARDAYVALDALAKKRRRGS